MANQPIQKNRRPQSNQSTQRRSRTPSLDETIKLVKQFRGKENLYGMISTNDRGDVTEVGVYNGNTKRYALYRSELVDADTLAEFKQILGK
jgi:hypothetical protein